MKLLQAKKEVERIGPPFDTPHDKQVIMDLKNKCRFYEMIDRDITAQKLRLLASDFDPKLDDLLKGCSVRTRNEGDNTIVNERYVGIESVKYACARKIKGLLEYYPLWNEWMDHVPGVGSRIAGNLILLWYYKFVPICKNCGGDLVHSNGDEVNDDDDDGDYTGNGKGAFVCSACGKKSKGGGLLKHRIEMRDFPKISGWRHFLGMHNTAHCPKCFSSLTASGNGNKTYSCAKCKKTYVEEDAKFLKPKRRKGSKVTWSPRGRLTMYHFGQGVQKRTANKGHGYRDYYDSRKKYREKTHPDYRPWRRDSMCLNEVSKLFAAHFWQVATMIDGKPLTEPWLHKKEPQHNIIPPYFWEYGLK